MKSFLKDRISILLIFSFILRAFFGGILELGNDEVYYVNYALFPALSHFDHPPMVGFLIQLSTLNMMLDYEFFIRFGSVLLGTFNTWLIFMLGKEIKDEYMGYISALLYTASFYGFVISGMFIMPDAPLMTFWFLSIWFFIKVIKAEKNNPAQSKKYLLLVGLFIGLGFLSKYQAIFVWIGIFFYLLFYKRYFFKKKSLYVAAVISLLVASPVLIWNIKYDFISFTFHGNRVGFFDNGIRFDFFLQQLIGNVFYNNPIIFFIILIAVIVSLKNKRLIDLEYQRLFFFIALPLIFVVLFFSLFRFTLPHWSAPAYSTLIIMGAGFFRAQKGSKREKIPVVIKIALLLLVTVVTFGALQVSYGVVQYPNKSSKPENLGRNDITLDMYGWKNSSVIFQRLDSIWVARKMISEDAVIISHKWFPAAHIDYYFARPLNKDLLVINTIDQIHKYAWINHKRTSLQAGDTAMFICTSRYYADPVELYGKNFKKIERKGRIVIRQGSFAKGNVFIFFMYDYMKEPDYIYKLE